MSYFGSVDTVISTNEDSLDSLFIRVLLIILEKFIFSLIRLTLLLLASLATLIVISEEWELLLYLIVSEEESL